MDSSDCRKLVAPRPSRLATVQVKLTWPSTFACHVQQNIVLDCQFMLYFQRNDKQKELLVISDFGAAT